MKTSYEEIVNVDNIATLNGMGDLGKVIKLAKSEKRNPAENDIEKNLLVGIDFQVCFMEQIGSLQVPHSKKDVENFTRFIYKNINKITTIMCSLDFHKYESIFFPCWWHDAEGNEAEPGTVVTYDAVKNGLWIPKYDKRIPDENNPTKLVSYCEEYIRFLEQECNENLIIWDYHALDGTYSANLETEFAKMVYFHAAYRGTDPIMVHKGTDSWSEMYGFIRPEYDGLEHINKEVLDTIMQYDKIIFGGEAASHCVIKSVMQVVEYFADRPDITRRIYILKDCMSPIPGFEEQTETKFEELKRKYGVKVVNSTELEL